jgi:hypothetical protein
MQLGGDIMNKSWWESKTLWFNILTGVGALTGPGAAFGHVFAPEEIGAFMGIGNIVLRLLTHKGLTK